MLRKNFGTEMTWWGIDNKEDPRPDPKTIKTPIIGGHAPLDYYRQLENFALMISTLREPISRAFSFWHYITMGSDQNVVDQWEDRGVDRKNLIASIERVSELRAELAGQQCFYLTGFREYAKARAVIKSGRYIVGVMTRLPLFAGAIAETLGMRFRRFPLTNEGSRNAKDSVSSDRCVLALLKELTREDRMLYADIDAAGVYASNRVGTLTRLNLPEATDPFGKYLVDSEPLGDAEFANYAYKEILGTQAPPRIATLWKERLQAGKVERRDICAEAFEVAILNGLIN